MTGVHAFALISAVLCLLGALLAVAGMRGGAPAEAQ
ncbi:hypothetical protein SRB17_43700 [Streptomyces sp. RB17]|nr:hypothetical protein [Streptomyces sp. RB17]